nr:hypothetical protein [Moraxella osloensis]
MKPSASDKSNTAKTDVAGVFLPAIRQSLYQFNHHSLPTNQ